MSAAVERLRRFVAADPAVFVEVGNRVREQRIRAAVHAAADVVRAHPDVAAVTVAAMVPLLTVADVVESQRMVADLLAECDAAQAVTR